MLEGGTDRYSARVGVGLPHEAGLVAGFRPATYQGSPRDLAQHVVNLMFRLLQTISVLAGGDRLGSGSAGVTVLRCRRVRVLSRAEQN